MKQALISSSVFQYLLQNPSACENWATKDETTIRGRSAHLGPMASPAGCSGTFKMFPARLCWENHLMIIIWKHEIHWDTFYTSIYKNQYLSSGLFGAFYECFTIWMWLLLWGRTPTPTPCLASLKASMNSITVRHCLSPGSCLLSEDLVKPTVKSCKVNLVQSSPKDLRRVLVVYIYILQICIKYVAHHSPACWSLIHESASGVNCSG